MHIRTKDRVPSFVGGQFEIIKKGLGYRRGEIKSICLSEDDANGSATITVNFSWCAIARGWSIELPNWVNDQELNCSINVLDKPSDLFFLFGEDCMTFDTPCGGKAVVLYPKGHESNLNPTSVEGLSL